MKYGLPLLCSYLCLLSSCIEKVAVTDDFNSNTNTTDIVVIEANLTNELKKQQTLLSNVNSYPNDSILGKESNAQVRIIDEMGRMYDFDETDVGVYTSLDTFDIEPNIQYRLEITTANGEFFISQPEKLPNDNKIQDLYAEKTISEQGLEGVSIFADVAQSNQINPTYR